MYWMCTEFMYVCLYACTESMHVLYVLYVGMYLMCVLYVCTSIKLCFLLYLMYYICLTIYLYCMYILKVCISSFIFVLYVICVLFYYYSYGLLLKIFISEIVFICMYYVCMWGRVCMCVWWRVLLRCLVLLSVDDAKKLMRIFYFVYRESNYWMPHGMERQARSSGC